MKIALVGISILAAFLSCDTPQSSQAKTRPPPEMLSVEFVLGGERQDVESVRVTITDGNDITTTERWNNPTIPWSYSVDVFDPYNVEITYMATREYRCAIKFNGSFVDHHPIHNGCRFNTVDKWWNWDK